MLRQYSNLKFLWLFLLLLSSAIALTYPSSAETLTEQSSSRCIIPVSGPWPPCATGGSQPPSGSPCPTSGKWPSGCIPPSQGSAGAACPTSGKWPPGCIPPSQTGTGGTCPSTGVWPAGCVPATIQPPIAQTPTNDLPADEPPAVELVETPEGDFAVITEIVDGDTVVADINGGAYTIRLIGIQATEPGETCADQASAKLAEYILGETVELKKDVSEADEYGRLLRYVHLNSTFINAEMLSWGLVFAVETPPDSQFSAEFTRLQDEARADVRGCLWNGTYENPPPITPTPEPTP